MSNTLLTRKTVFARITKRMADECDEAVNKGKYLNLSDLVRSALRNELKSNEVEN